MKGFRTLLCVISLALSGVIVSDVMAQKELGVFNSLAVGALRVKKRRLFPVKEKRD